MKRTIYVLAWDRKNEGWFVSRRTTGWKGRPYLLLSTKIQGLTHGRYLAFHNQPSQLIVKNKNGRIAFEHTYGRDPRRHKG